MRDTLRYLWLTIKHKWFVFLAGLATKAPLWRLLIHDWSKFTLAEAPYYGRQFFGAADEPYGFSCAWNHHQKTNPHHWEYWVMVSGHNRGGYEDGCALRMPQGYVREMVADWLGASRAYEGVWPTSLETWPWWQDNFDRLRLHSDTRALCLLIVWSYFEKRSR